MWPRLPRSDRVLARSGSRRSSSRRCMSGARSSSPFKGRDSAIGGTVGYTFKIGDPPISPRVKVLRDFDVKNRLHGTVGWLPVSFPLWVQAKSAEAPQSIDPR